MSAQSTGFNAMPGWYWPEEGRSRTTPAGGDAPPSSSASAAHGTASHSPSSDANQDGSQGTGQRHYRPRTCRICLDTVQPSFELPSENLPSIFQGRPQVVYQDENGRLIRPCRCRGSARYVHENCLQAWRHADPGYASRNYFHCPTCGYRYRMSRMSVSRYISSAFVQVFLTIAIMILAVFLLGFIADPIINIYLDPMSSLWPFGGGMIYGDEYTPTTRVVPEEPPASWGEHFFKGTASLGVLGFLKVMIASPLNYIRLGGGGRAGRTGRDRANDVSTVVILIGVATFAYAVWKGVRAWVRRTLERASEHIMDVQGEDDGDGDDEGDE